MFRESLQKTKLFGFLKDSCGDWRYPWFVLKWKIARFLLRRRKVKMDQFEISLPCDNQVTHFRWYLYKTKEVEVRNYLDQYLKEGDVLFDIGANIGVFSLYAAKRFNQIKVYSFEPEYSNLNLLKDNVIHNNLQSKIKSYGVAVSDFVGLSQLHLQDFLPGSACHTESRETIQKTDEGYQVQWSEGISCVTLDYLSKELNVVPNAIKIDTDGNEDKILRGASETLRNKALRSLVLEMPMQEDKKNFCVKQLSEAGFQLKWSDEAKTRNQIWAR